MEQTEIERNKQATTKKIQSDENEYHGIESNISVAAHFLQGKT